MLPNKKGLYEIQTNYPKTAHSNECVGVSFYLGPVGVDLAALEQEYRAIRKRPSSNGFEIWLMKSQGFCDAYPHTTYIYGRGVWTHYDPLHPDKDIQPGENVPYEKLTEPA